MKALRLKEYHLAKVAQSVSGWDSKQGPSDLSVQVLNHLTPS